MAKQTQLFKLAQLFKASDTLTPLYIAENLQVTLISVPVYIHKLKEKFNARIDSVHEGKRVVAYKMLNPDDVEVPEFGQRNPKSVKNILPKNSPVLLNEIDDVTNGTLSDKDLEDVKGMLDLDTRGYGAD